jgi:CRP-like cAMP-binding protein
MNKGLFWESPIMKEVGFGGAFLHALAAGVEERIVQKGRSVTASSAGGGLQGGRSYAWESKTLFMLGEGILYVRKDGRDVCAISSGEMFTQAGAQQHGHGSYEFVSGETSVVLCIGHDTLENALLKYKEEDNYAKLQHLLEQHLHTREKVWQRLVRLQQQSDELNNAGFSIAFLSDLVENARSRDFQVHQVIIEEGSSSRDLYVLQEGHVSEHQNGKDIQNLQPGSVFGETASLDLISRQGSTYEAVQKCQCLVIPQKVLVQALERHPGQVDCMQRLKQMCQAKRNAHGGNSWMQGLGHKWTTGQGRTNLSSGLGNHDRVASRDYDRSHAAHGSNTPNRQFSGGGGYGGHGGDLAEATLMRQLRFSNQFLQSLQSGGSTQQFHQNQSIIRENQSDAQQCICFLKSGSCRVQRGSSEVCRLAAGDIFGEANLESHRHSVTVTALSECMVISYSKQRVQQAIQQSVHQSPEDIEKLERLKQQLAQKWRTTNSSSFGRQGGGGGYDGGHRQGAKSTHTSRSHGGGVGGGDSTDSDNDRGFGGFRGHR